MDHTTYFSVEESTVYTSQLNKRKLASVGIEGTYKFCVKQQIYSYFSRVVQYTRTDTTRIMAYSF